MIASPRNNLPVGLALFPMHVAIMHGKPVGRVSRQSGASDPQLGFSARKNHLAFVGLLLVDKEEQFILVRRRTENGILI